MKKEIRRNYSFVAIAAILYGTLTFGAQFFTNLGLSAYEISIYSIFFLSLVLLPFAFIKKYSITKKAIPFFILYGLINAIQEATQFGAIVLAVPVAVVAFLLYSQPVWTSIFAKIILREKITKRKILAIIIAILGIFILIKPWDVGQIGSVFGIILAIIGGISLSLWIILGRKSGIDRKHVITTTSGMAFSTLFWLLVLWPIITLFIKDQTLTRLSLNLPPHYFLFLLIFSLISSLIPHFFFYKGVQKIQASTAGIILLLEPISATFLANIFFKQPITTNIIIGGILILLSNYIIAKE